MVSFLLEINGKSISIQYHAVKTTESLHEQLIISVRNPDGSKWYYHPDHLGSTSLITDQSGNVVENTFYSPYGELLGGGTQDVKLYTSQFKDNVNCQYYYGARYYNPCNAMFIQPDTVFQNKYNPQMLNHYSYTLNNPYKYIDPTGKVTVGIRGWNQYSATDMSVGVNYIVANSVDPSKKTFSFWEVEEAKQFILSELAKNPDQPVVIVGYSWGGERSVRLSSLLKAEGVKVNKLVTIDAFQPLSTNIFKGKVSGGSLYVSNNVLSSTNYYETQSRLPGAILKGQNVQNNPVSGVGHSAIGNPGSEATESAIRDINCGVWVSCTPQNREPKPYTPKECGAIMSCPRL